MLQPPNGSRQPAFNVPQVILTLLMVLWAVHLVRTLVLADADAFQILLQMSFIPARYFADLGDLLGGTGALLWSPFTYSLLHADFTHLVINSLWMLVFGSAVARRFGVLRFLALSALAAAGGAILHLVSYPNDVVPLVGASAAIAGQMSAAVRFVFEPGGPMIGGNRSASAWFLPAPALKDLFQNRMVLLFVGIWFALNFITGVGTFSAGGGGSSIAWQAHVGGFLVGLFVFPYLDPVGGGPTKPVARKPKNLSKFKVIEGDRRDS